MKRQQRQGGTHGLIAALLICLLLLPSPLAASVPVQQLADGWFGIFFQPLPTAEELIGAGMEPPQNLNLPSRQATPVSEESERKLPLMLSPQLCLMTDTGEETDWPPATLANQLVLCFVVGGGDEQLRRLSQRRPELVYVPLPEAEARAFLQ